MKMTTANLVTLIRIAMIPLYMIVYAICGNTSLLAVAIFVLASVTDAVDGYIARHYNQVTDFGKFVDPLADKLLILAALLMLTADGVLPAWCGMVVLTREFIISSLRMVAASKGIVAGVSEDSFAPDAPLTREQLATILYAYEKANGGGFTGSWMFLLNYPDRADVAEWAYEPLCWMTMHQVMTGKDSGMLDPKGLATRAEAAQMLMRYLKG